MGGSETQKKPKQNRVKSMVLFEYGFVQELFENTGAFLV